MAEETEAKVLFQRPILELRERFVQQRFAESQYFGNWDIEGWLEKQRQGDGQHVGWRAKYLGCISSNLERIDDPRPVLRRILETNAEGFDPGEILNFPYPYPGGIPEEIGVLMRVLNPAYVRMYCDQPSVPTLVFMDFPKTSAVTVQMDKGLGGFHAATADEVVRIVMRTWERDSPRAVLAQRFLCDELAKVIAKVRGEAEADFDRAVAVSADGLRIIHADYVVVLGDGEDADDVCYPATAFTEKILLRDLMYRRNEISSWRHMLYDPLREHGHWGEARDLDTRVYRVHVARFSGCQDFMDCGTGNPGNEKKRILFVRLEDCPQPLPEGGEVLTKLVK